MFCFRSCSLVLILSTLAALHLQAGEAKPSASAAVDSEAFFTCGFQEVALLDAAKARKGVVEKLWTWRAADHEELPAAVRGKFGTTDDCKPVRGDAGLLVSSSGGACALVERPSGRVLWYARAANAHTLELLPKDRVAVASSVSPDGNRLLIFDLAHSDQPIWQTPLPSAHGLAWDEDRHRLWALGLEELRQYELKDWESDAPSLTLIESIPLPDKDGHELQPVAHSADLIVSTASHVYLFDRDKRTFRPHPVLGGRTNIKCISANPATGETLFLQAGGANWWTDTFHFLDPEDTAVQVPGFRFYKARWAPTIPAKEPQ